MPASRAVSCGAPISNRKATDGPSMWREETSVKCLKRTLRPKKKEEWRERIFCNVVREPEAIFRGKRYGYKPKPFL